MTCDRIAAVGAGQRRLAIFAAVVSGVALVTLVVVGGIPLTASVLSPILPGLLVLGFLLLIYRVLLFGFRRRQPARGRGVGRLAVDMVKGLARIVRAPQAKSARGGKRSTEVRRFRVTEVSGRTVDCELVGKVTGTPLQQGDVVDVFGRTTRHGSVRARVVVVTSNQARITASPHLGFVLARIAYVVVVALPAVCVISIAYLLVSR